MALAFKRAQKEVETGITEANNKLESYGPGKKTFEVNFEEIKKIEGKTNLWTNSEEKPKNEIGVLYVAQALPEFAVMINSYVCNDEPGKTAFNAACDKIYVTVDDKGKDGENIHDFKFNGKTLEWHAHLDFSRYVCQSIKQEDAVRAIKKELDSREQLGFFRAKKALLDGAAWNLDRLKQTCPKIVVDYDFDGMKKVTGFSSKIESGKEIAKNEVCVRYAAECMLLGVIQCFERVGQDELGKEALNEFTKIVLHVDDQGPGSYYGKHEVKKNGTEVHFFAHIDFDGYPLQSYPVSDDVAKKLEAVL